MVLYDNCALWLQCSMVTVYYHSGVLQYTVLVLLRVVYFHIVAVYYDYGMLYDCCGILRLQCPIVTVLYDYSILLLQCTIAMLSIL